MSPTRHHTDSGISQVVPPSLAPIQRRRNGTGAATVTQYIDQVTIAIMMFCERLDAQYPPDACGQFPNPIKMFEKRRAPQFPLTAFGLTPELITIFRKRCAADS